MNKFVSKSILSSMSAVALLMAASPAIDAQENSDQVSESAVKDNQQENIKEVNTYEEFKNSKDHREAIRKRKSKYRKSRGRNRNRGIVPCLQGRTYTP